MEGAGEAHLGEKLALDLRHSEAAAVVAADTRRGTLTLTCLTQQSASPLVTAERAAQLLQPTAQTETRAALAEVRHLEF